MTEKKINVEGLGNVYVSFENGNCSVSDAQGNYMGEFDPSDVEGWDENDEYIMSQCIADLIDEGTLETPSDIEDDYADF